MAGTQTAARPFFGPFAPTADGPSNLLDAGAIRIDSQGRFSLDVPKTKRAVTSLTTQIMTLQAHGDYAGVKRLLDRMSVIRPEVQRVLDQLNKVPVDIAPQFVTANTLAP